MTAAGDLDRAVSAAVAGLYQAFGQRPGAAIQGCPCCVDPADSAAMARLAREDLPVELALRYAFKAMTTWGDEADFRWYLPRIADLVARGALELDLLTGKLVYGAWTTWAAAERAAVVAFLDACWSRAVAGSADGSHMLEELLAVRIDLGLDVEPWIDGLADAPLPALADLVQVAIADRGGVATALRARLVTAAMLDRLTAGYVATGDERLAAAADLLTCEPALP
jgi:hypothetical protein